MTTEDCWCLRYHFTDLDGNEVICEHSCHGADEYAEMRGWLAGLLVTVLAYWLLGRKGRRELERRGELPGLPSLSGLPLGLAREGLEGDNPIPRAGLKPRELIKIAPAKNAGMGAR